MGTWSGAVRRVATLTGWVRRLGRPPADVARLRLGRRVSLTLDPRDVAHRSILASGLVEVEETYAVWCLGRAGGTLLDVGANHGYYTALWASLRADNRVLAVEASPPCLAALRGNVRRNGLEAQVQVVGCAAGARPGRLAFAPGPPGQTGWGGLSLGPAPWQVEVRPLDAIVAGAPWVEAPVVLKVDVEGAEAWVLEGATALLESGAVTHVLFEENPSRRDALAIPPGAARRLLEAHGYRSAALGDSVLATAPGARPPERSVAARARFALEACGLVRA